MRNGFTLIELLAAMVAGSLLLVLLGWVTSNLARGEQRARQDNFADLSRGGAFFVRNVERIGSPTHAADAILTPDHLRLPVSPPDALGTVGLVDLDMQLVGAGDTRTLLAYYERRDGASLPVFATTPRAVLTKLRSAQFVIETGEPNGWPRLLTLAFTAANGRQYRVTAHPPIDAAPTCRFDPITLTCT